MTDHAHVIRVAKYRPLPGSDAKLLEALNALATGMRGVPGLFGAQVCRVTEDPELLALVARWEHEQAMMATGDPRLQELIDAAAGFVEDQQVEHFIAQ
jgi:quinol monooxygenase YgiN